MRLKRQRHPRQGPFHSLPGLQSIVLSELFRHIGMGHDEVFFHRRKHLQHRGHIIHQREVDDFHTGPRGKPAVGNHEGVRMPNAGQQREKVRIKNTCLEHGIVDFSLMKLPRLRSGQSRAAMTARATPDPRRARPARSGRSGRSTRKIGSWSFLESIEKRAILKSPVTDQSGAASSGSP